MKYEEFVQMKYKKYFETLQKEAALNVYLDLTNMFHKVKDMYIDFGKFYQGKKTYIKSENPAFGGTA